MPAVNPRITITLKPQTYAALQRMSALAGNSMSSIVGELLEQSQPVFDRMILLMEAAGRIRDSAKEERERITKGLEEAQATMEEQLGLSLDWMDGVGAPILEAAERLNRRAGRSAPSNERQRESGADLPAARLTPLSNRGVTTVKNTTSVPKARKQAARKPRGQA